MAAKLAVLILPAFLSLLYLYFLVAGVFSLLGRPLPFLKRLAAPLPQGGEKIGAPGRFRGSPGLAAAFAFLSRIMMYIIAYVFQKSSGAIQGTFWTSLERLWVRWDGAHYLSIAQKGYLTTGDERNFIVFYPLYPALTKVLGVLLGGRYFLAGITLSVLSFSLGCYFLYRLADELWGSRAALRSVLLACAFPATHFFGAPMSEGLFFLLSISAVFYIRKHKFILGGVLGALAALTRNFGVLLVIPLACEIFTAKPRGKRLAAGLSGIFIVLLGTFSYLALNYAVTGNMFTFLEIQKSHWQQQFQFPYKSLKSIVEYVFANKQEWPRLAALWIPQLFSITVFLAAFSLGGAALPAPLMLYSAAYIFVALSPSWLLSAPRYLLPLFPVYISLSMLLRKKIPFYISLGLLLTLALLYLKMFLIGWPAM